MKYSKYKILIFISVIVLSLFVVASFLPISEGFNVMRDKLNPLPPPPGPNDEKGFTDMYNLLKAKSKEIANLRPPIKAIIQEMKSNQFKKKTKAYRDAKKADLDSRRKAIKTKVANYNAYRQWYINAMNRSQTQLRSGRGPGSPGSIENAAPRYPLYKFKGCWTYGHDVTYPVLDSRMVFANVKNMEECVGKNSLLGVPTAAYDGKNICMGGMFDYKTKTSAKCVDTYPNGKSWLVYSKSAL
jgi:hypothetical protein